MRGVQERGGGGGVDGAENHQARVGRMVTPNKRWYMGNKK